MSTSLLDSELPLAGGLQFFFITKPDLDFDFVGVAKIANLPDIKDKIKEELLKDLMAQAVYPGRITVPLSFLGAGRLTGLVKGAALINWFSHAHVAAAGHR